MYNAIQDKKEILLCHRVTGSQVRLFLSAFFIAGVVTPVFSFAVESWSSDTNLMDPHTSLMSQEINGYRRARQQQEGFFEGVQPKEFIEIRDAYQQRLAGQPLNGSVFNNTHLDALYMKARAQKNTDLLFYIAKGYEFLGIPDDQNQALLERENLIRLDREILDDAWAHVAEQHNMTVEELENTLRTPAGSPAGIAF